MANRDNSIFADLLAGLLGPLVFVILLVSVFSCSPRIVEHIVTRRDTTYIEKVQVDSIYQRDSILVREKGDTVFIYKEHIRDRWRFIHDTTYMGCVDSVFIEHTKVVEVDKPLSKWKAAQIGAFWYLCGALLLCLLWIFRKPLIKLFKP